ncbi:hypothetical protein [Microcoleus sp. CZ3-B4]
MGGLVYLNSGFESWLGDRIDGEKLRAIHQKTRNQLVRGRSRTVT